MDIIFKINLKSKIGTLIFWITPRELIKYVKNDSPFLKNVAKEGLSYMKMESLPGFLKASFEKREEIRKLNKRNLNVKFYSLKAMREAYPTTEE